MSKTQDTRKADKGDDDDRVLPREVEDEPEEIFTDLRDGRDEVELPDGTDDALDELSASLGLKDEDDETAEEGAGESDDDKEAAAAEEAANEEATKAARAEDFRKNLFERKKSSLQLISSQAETLEAKEVSAKTLKASAERIIAGYADRMKALKEAGDTDGEIALQTEGLDARENLSRASATLDEIARTRPVLLGRLKDLGWNGKSFDETESDKSEIEKIAGTKAAGGDAQKSSKHSAAFLKANAWFNDKKHAGQRELLLAMDKALRLEGKIDVDDPKYFTTLAERFNRVPAEAGGKPGLIRDIGGKAIATGVRTRGRGRGGAMPSGGLGSVDDGDSGGGGGNQLTSLDLRTMRTFGMDPTKKSDRTAFLSEKKADARRSVRA